MQMKTILAAGGALVLAGGGWWLLAPHGQAPTASEAPDAVGAAAVRPDGLLLVAPAKARALGIVTAPAQPASEVPLADLPVTIAPPPNARVAVAATLPGTVLRTLVVEGDSVSRGQALAVVASRDVMTLSADLARANARAGVARSSAARLNQLSREGIIAGARADEARALAAEAGADVAEKSRILRLVGSNRGGGTYTLTAPIAGRVTKADIQAGMPLDGTTAPFVIDAAGRYEATGQVPERLIGQIRPGMTVRWARIPGVRTPEPCAARSPRSAMPSIRPPARPCSRPSCPPARASLRAGSTPSPSGARLRPAPGPAPIPRQVGRGHHRSRGRGHHAGHR
jgi:cobalt-zinc-cadmium efflux system membrane fusion protein